MDLTDRSADAATPHQLPLQERAGDHLLVRALGRARWTIFWERLWPAHIERALRAANTLRAGTPMPRLALRDPFAVRALVAVLVVATFFAAGGERMKRVAAAFDWQGVMMPANFRIDAWVSPPPYTGRPPVILPGLRPGEPVQSAAALSVPAGSKLGIPPTRIHPDLAASARAGQPFPRPPNTNANG